MTLILQYPRRCVPTTPNEEELSGAPALAELYTGNPRHAVRGVNDLVSTSAEVPLSWGGGRTITSAFMFPVLFTIVWW